MVLPAQGPVYWNTGKTNGEQCLRSLGSNHRSFLYLSPFKNGVDAFLSPGLLWPVYTNVSFSQVADN